MRLAFERIEGITVCLVSITLISSTTEILGQRDINHVRTGKEEPLVSVAAAHYRLQGGH